MTNTATDSKTFFFVPHTHWEGAVFKTREQYLEMGLPNILRALRLLKTYPAYRFVLDQACYVKPFLERYPEEEDTFRRFIAEGRLAIVGGTDSMPDVNMPCGESFVRQILYGKGYFRKVLGVDVTVGWQLDTFGHHAQMPQLMKLAGYRSFWFFRGVSDWNVPSEFLWEGLDGSQIPAFWLPHGYAVTFGSPGKLPEFTRFMKERFDLLEPFSRGASRVGLAGADVCEPEEQVPRLLDEFNRQPDAPFHLRIAVPAEFEVVAASGPDRPVITGELNPIFQGTYSSRIEIKQRTRELERLLLTAEKLGALLDCVGLSGTSGNSEINNDLWQAWEPMLFNQAHDLMSGVMTDGVYEDTIRSYNLSLSLAEEALQERLRAYGAAIDTTGEGIALVVFNPLSWTRTDIALARVGFSDSGVQGVKVIRMGGEPVPVQMVNAGRHQDGSLLWCEIAFRARDVPPLGHAVYRILPLRSTESPDPVVPSTGEVAVLENESYRLELDPHTGAMTHLVVKAEGWDALSGPANVVVREEDHGDLWEPYRSLDGGSRIAMKDRHPVPPRGQAAYSDEETAEPGSVTTGPVFSEFSVAHPFGSGSFSTRVRLYEGLRRIEIRTTLRNEDEFVRYRALFPTSITDGHAVHEIPFGAISRPEGIEFPAQNWMGFSNGERGVALLNRGLPGNNVDSGALILSLLRSTCIVAYGFGGGYEPGMSSDSGLEKGKEFTFDYAVAPHSGDWRQAGIYRDGLEFNNPLIAFTASNHTGALPKSHGFLVISHPNVVLSTLRSVSKGGEILRVYEAAGEPAKDVTIWLPAGATRAEEVNLMEDHIGPIEIVDRTIRFDLAPFEIKTVSFLPGPAGGI